MAVSDISSLENKDGLEVFSVEKLVKGGIEDFESAIVDSIASENLSEVIIAVDSLDRELTETCPPEDEE